MKRGKKLRCFPAAPANKVEFSRNELLQSAGNHNGRMFSYRRCNFFMTGQTSFRIACTSTLTSGDSFTTDEKFSLASAKVSASKIGTVNESLSSEVLIFRRAPAVGPSSWMAFQKGTHSRSRASTRLEPRHLRV